MIDENRLKLYFEIIDDTILKSCLCDLGENKRHRVVCMTSELIENSNNHKAFEFVDSSIALSRLQTHIVCIRMNSTQEVQYATRIHRYYNGLYRPLVHNTKSGYYCLHKQLYWFISFPPTISILMQLSNYNQKIEFLGSVFDNMLHVHLNRYSNQNMSGDMRVDCKSLINCLFNYKREGYTIKTMNQLTATHRFQFLDEMALGLTISR